MKNNDKTVLVTGANGFLGRHVCEIFLRKGFFVFAGTRSHNPEHIPIGTKYLKCDLNIPGDWEDALQDVQYVVHCAGNAKFGNGKRFYRDNVDTTKILVAAIKNKAKNFKRLIFVSSIAAMDRSPHDNCDTPLTETSPENPSTDYGKSKLCAEKLIKLCGLPFSIIRAAQVVGSDMRQNSHFSVFAKWALKKSLITRVGWPGVFSVVEVRDLANAIFICAEKKGAAGKTFLCGGHRISLLEYFSYVSEGWSIPIKPLTKMTRSIIKYLPFSLKSLLLPCMDVDDTALQNLGWTVKFNKNETLDGVVQRETARVNPIVDSGLGITVITGAASGLGLAFVNYLAGRRKHLLLIDRDEAALKALEKKFPNCEILVANLSNQKDIEGINLNDKWNALPIAEMFSCAGFGARGNFLDLNIQTQLDMMKVNLLARMQMVYAASKSMQNQKFGRIVLICSSSAFQALPAMSVYAASNSALLSFGEGIAYEMAPSGIQVLTVCPGGMNTNFQESAGVKKLKNEKLMSPEKVVDFVMEGLKSSNPVLYISSRSKAMKLLSRVLPTKISLKLWGGLMNKMR